MGFISRIDAMRLRGLRLAATLGVAALLGAADASQASAWANAQQLVLVVSADWDATTAMQYTFSREQGRWQAQGPATPVAIGRTGSAWGIGLHPAQAQGPRKREGDGRSPAGVFTVGAAFGYATSANTGLEYRPMSAHHYCMDVNDSAFYNQIVDRRQVGADAVRGSTEPMRLDLHGNGDPRYRQGFVIRHNPDNRPGAGSCIFAHLWRKPGEATAGCTAMAEGVMHGLLGWLRPDQHPVFVLLPYHEYLRLRDDWQLPTLAEET